MRREGNPAGRADGVRSIRATWSMLFVVVSVLGTAEAVYHAWLERAFTTNPFAVDYSVYASFLGVPYWVFGVVWFPLLLVLSLWFTGGGRRPLSRLFLALLSVGNFFTVYLWYLDLDVIKVYTTVYVALYVTNYILTALVVVENRSDDSVQGFGHGTIAGVVLGGGLAVLLGPVAIAACAVSGSVLGSLRNWALPKKPLV